MKFLFFTSFIKDYLADTSHDGLKLLYTKDCEDSHESNLNAEV
ncbi:MAG TPA: hypothetical protein VK589_24390 [Chryseolinea sp.]|nr:hypothetical protein [Chryseolinea sp.]